jgi:hypothetical protein
MLHLPLEPRVNDEQLSKLAALAAGYTLLYDDNGVMEYRDENLVYQGCWYPLVSSVQAFILANRLRLSVRYRKKEVALKVSVKFAFWMTEPFTDDIDAAVRRIIVRAAAAIEYHKQNQEVS